MKYPKWFGGKQPALARIFIKHLLHARATPTYLVSSESKSTPLQKGVWPSLSVEQIVSFGHSVTLCTQ